MAVVAILAIAIDTGQAFQVVPSHDSLEIRGSHHKSTDLNAPQWHNPADLTSCANSVGFEPINVDKKNPRDRYRRPC